MRSLGIPSWSLLDVLKLTVGLLILASTAGADEACRISADGRGLSIRVAPPGGTPFDVRLGESANAILELAPGTPSARATALSGLSFVGTVEWAQIRLVPRDDLALGGGLARVKDWQPLQAMQVLDGGRVRVRLPFSPGLALVTDLECHQVVHESAWHGEKLPDDGKRTWIPKATGALELRGEPGAGERLELEVTEPTQARFQKLGARRGWLQVRAIFPGQTRLDGWIRADAMRPWTAPRPPRRSHSDGGGYLSALEGGAPKPGKPGIWEGPATIRQGTRVHDGPSGPVWAMVTLGTNARVSMRDGEAWAQLMAAYDLPFLCYEGDPCHAWVPRSAVSPAD